MISTKRFNLSAIALLLSLTACTTISAMAQEPISLFDGETLAGWRATEENPSSFRVEDGTIVAEGPRAHLFYDGVLGTEFSDFELNLKVKTEHGANSGVYFHTAYQAEGWPSKGIEAQVNATQHDYRKTGSIYSIADIRVYSEAEELPVLGWDSNPFVVLDNSPHEDGEWFDYTIRVEKGQVSTWVSEELMVTWQQPSDWSQPEKRLSTGTFALQAHDPDSKVSFKEITVIPLD